MLYGYIDILAKTQQEMRFSHHTKIYLETALLKMVQFSGGIAHQTVTTNEMGENPDLTQKLGLLNSWFSNYPYNCKRGLQCKRRQHKRATAPS